MSNIYSILGDDPIFILKDRKECLVLELVADSTGHSYESKQHEYNRIYRLLSEAEKPLLLFECSQARVLDPILLGIMIELTNRSRALGGNACLSGLTPELDRSLSRLMRLQPINKRASWEIYPELETAISALPWE